MEFQILKAIPAPIRRAVRAVLPAEVVDKGKAKLLVWIYDRGQVQQEPKALVFVKRKILRTKPTLYHLEIKITGHCNLRCLGCTNFSNISKAEFLDLGDFAADCERVSKLLRVSNFYLMGGEPLLHPEVGEFARVTRKHFPRANIWIFTNCLLIPRMSDEVWRAFSESKAVLYCDDYPVGIDREAIDAMAVQHGVKVRWTEPRNEFFRVPVDLEGGQDPAKSFATCWNIDNCVNLRDGRLYPCGRVAYMDVFQERYGIGGLDPAETDSISIYEDRNPWEIMDFLLRPIPWCRHCDYEHMYWFPWQRGADTLEQWTEPDPNVGQHEPSTDDGGANIQSESTHE